MPTRTAELETWRQRASQCRRLAKAMHQEDVVQLLIDLAEELEGRARAVQPAAALPVGSGD